MLILTRKTDEKILIGDNISIMVVSIEKGRVKLGITAPKEIPVHREEIYNEIKNKKEREYDKIQNQHYVF